MNPIEFINNGYPTILESKKNFNCRISLPDGTVLEGLFIGIRECKSLPQMEGFILDCPIYKVGIMHNNPDGTIVPLWVNTLLIESITDIQFS